MERFFPSLTIADPERAIEFDPFHGTTNIIHLRRARSDRKLV